MTDLSEWDNQTASGFLFTSEADIIGGDEHLSEDVHLVEGSPQGTIGVTVQLLIFGKAEKRPVSFAFSPGIQIPKHIISFN